MFTLFKSDPIKKAKKLYTLKLEQAMQAQRNGDIRRYSELSVEAEELYKKMTLLQSKENNR